MVLREMQFSSFEFGELQDTHFAKERAYFSEVARHPRYLGDLGSLVGEERLEEARAFFSAPENFTAEPSENVIITCAGIRAFRPYELPEAPEGGFFSNRFAYFMPDVSPDVLKRKPKRTDSEARFRPNQEAVYYAYTQPAVRQILDIVCVLQPDMIKALEYRFFDLQQVPDIMKSINREFADIHNDVNLCLRLLGVTEKAGSRTEKRYNRWFGPVIRDFPEIQQRIVEFPRDLQKIAWEYVRGAEAMDVANQHGIKLHDSKNFRREILDGRNAGLTLAFKEEREKEQIKRLWDVPFAKQDIVRYIRDFLAMKINGEQNVAIGEKLGIDPAGEREGVAVLSDHLLDLIIEVFPYIGIADYAARKGRRKDSFLPSGVTWSRLLDYFNRLVENMTIQRRVLTVGQEVFLTKVIAGEKLTSQEKRLVSLFLGNYGRRRERHAESMEIVREFVEAGGLEMVSDETIREIILLMHVETPYAQIVRKFPTLTVYRFIGIQKQIRGYLAQKKNGGTVMEDDSETSVDEVSPQDFTTRIPVFDQAAFSKLEDWDRMPLAVLRREVGRMKNTTLQAGDLPVSLSAVMFIFAVHTRTFDAFDPERKEVNASELKKALEVCEAYMTRSPDLTPTLKELVKAFMWFLREGRYIKT